MRNRAKILWDFCIQTGRDVLANKPDIVVVDNKQKIVVVIGVVEPRDSNTRKKEYENLEKNNKS